MVSWPPYYCIPFLYRHSSSLRLLRHCWQHGQPVIPALVVAGLECRKLRIHVTLGFKEQLVEGVGGGLIGCKLLCTAENLYKRLLARTTDQLEKSLKTVANRERPTPPHSLVPHCFTAPKKRSLSLHKAQGVRLIRVTPPGVQLRGASRQGEVGMSPSNPPHLFWQRKLAAPSRERL